MTADDLAALEAAMADPEPDYDTEPDPGLADERKATALLRALGEKRAALERLGMLRDHALAQLEEKADRARRWYEEEAEPIERHMAWLTRWLENWQRAQLGEDRKGNPTGLTRSLPSGKLELRAQQPEIEIDEERFLAWAMEHRPDLVRRPDPEPWRPDGKALRAAVTSMSLRDVPDGEQVQAMDMGEYLPGVRVTVRGRKFTAKPFT